MFTLYKMGDGAPYKPFNSLNGGAIGTQDNIAYAFWARNNGERAIIRLGPDQSGQSYTVNGVTKTDGAVMKFIAISPNSYATAGHIDSAGDFLFTKTNPAGVLTLYRLKNVAALPEYDNHTAIPTTQTLGDTSTSDNGAFVIDYGPATCGNDVTTFVGDLRNTGYESRYVVGIRSRLTLTLTLTLPPSSN